MRNRSTRAGARGNFGLGRGGARSVQAARNAQAVRVSNKSGSPGRK